MDPLKALLNSPLHEQKTRGYQHTAGEIAQQPATWRRTWSRLRAQLPAIQNFLAKAGSHPDTAQSSEVFLVGAGTSDYIGRCLFHLLRQSWKCEVTAVPSTDLLIDFADIVLPQRPALWISFSRSGDSPEGVAVLERALREQPQIHHLVVSCNAPGNMMQCIADRPNCLGILLDEETNDRGLAMTSSFTNMVITGHALAHAWSPQAYDPIAKALCDAAEQLLPLAAQTAEKLAQRRYPYVCFVGSGANAGTATESALKLMELTAGQIKTMSQTTLGLRHGPMAALNKDTLFVSFLSTQERRQRYEMDLLREIERKQLVGHSLAILGAGASTRPKLASTELLTPANAFPVPDIYRPPVDILFAQLLGLFSSLHCGLKPDAPSPTGAISRVVQPIKVY